MRFHQQEASPADVRQANVGIQVFLLDFGPAFGLSNQKYAPVEPHIRDLVLVSYKRSAMLLTVGAVATFDIWGN
jgi:hypothetical protein